MTTIRSQEGQKMESKGFGKFLDNSVSGSNFYSNLNCLISGRPLAEFELILKTCYFQSFKETVPVMQFFYFVFFFIFNPALWPKAIHRLILTNILAFFGSFHPQNFDAMITSDRQHVLRTPITRVVKNEQYQSFQPIVWPEKSLSYASRHVENRVGRGILPRDNSCAP